MHFIVLSSRMYVPCTCCLLVLVPVALYPVHVPCTCLQCGVHISHGRILIDHQNLLLWGKEQREKNRAQQGCEWGSSTGFDRGKLSGETFLRVKSESRDDDSLPWIDTLTFSFSVFFPSFFTNPDTFHAQF